MNFMIEIFTFNPFFVKLTYFNNLQTIRNIIVSNLIQY